jgi:hypothetical protein
LLMKWKRNYVISAIDISFDLWSLRNSVFVLFGDGKSLSLDLVALGRLFDTF